MYRHNFRIKTGQYEDVNLFIGGWGRSGSGREDCRRFRLAKANAIAVVESKVLLVRR
jgi:hypothetical protein